MKKYLILIFLLSCSKIVTPQKVQLGVVSSGGASIQNSNHRVIATIGQPAVGVMSNSLSTHNAGFLYMQGSNVVSAVKETSAVIPLDYRLEQNYPNPFNPSTTIRFSIPKSSHVMLKIFDILGREVATLVDEEMDAGEYKTIFEANELPNGVYLYRLTTEKFSQMKKILLLK